MKKFMNKKYIILGIIVFTILAVAHVLYWHTDLFRTAL